MTGEMWYKHPLMSVGENRLDFLFICLRSMWYSSFTYIHLLLAQYTVCLHPHCLTCYHFKNIFLIFNQRIKAWPHRPFICLGLGSKLTHVFGRSSLPVFRKSEWEGHFLVYLYATSSKKYVTSLRGIYLYDAMGLTGQIILYPNFILAGSATFLFGN